LNVASTRRSRCREPWSRRKRGKRSRNTPTCGCRCRAEKPSPRELKGKPPPGGPGGGSSCHTCLAQKDLRPPYHSTVRPRNRRKGSEATDAANLLRLAKSSANVHTVSVPIIAPLTIVISQC